MKFIYLLIISIMISCSNSSEGIGNAASDIYDFIKGAQNRSSGTFWVTDIEKNFGDEGYFYELAFTERFENSSVIIYVETSRSHTIDTLTLLALGSEFKNVIKPSVEGIYKSPSDLDDNEKTIILLFDIKDGFNGSNGFVGGYFYSVDMYTQSLLNRQPFPESTAKTNYGEILYIDMVQQDPTSESVFYTIAHEYQHLVSFNQRHLLRDNISLDTWMNEGVAENMEYLTYGQKALDSRAHYLSRFYDSNTSLLKWSETDRLSSYALSALYFNFLVNKMGNTSFLHDLIKQNEDDYLGVGKQLNSVYSTGSNRENFKKSFYEFSIDGLYKVKTGVFPTMTKGSSHNVPGKFVGISTYNSLSISDEGYVPRFLKFSENSSVTSNGSQIIIDLNETNSSITETTSISQIGKYSPNNYGVAFIATANTNSSSFTVSTNGSFISTKKKSRQKYNKAHRIHFEHKPIIINQ